MRRLNLPHLKLSKRLSWPRSLAKKNSVSSKRLVILRNVSRENALNVRPWKKRRLNWPESKRMPNRDFLLRRMIWKEQDYSKRPRNSRIKRSYVRSARPSKRRSAISLPPKNPHVTKLKQSDSKMRHAVSRMAPKCQLKPSKRRNSRRRTRPLRLKL